eukprot:s2415_g5.t1
MVKKDYFYLGLLDLALLAFQRGRDILCCFNEANAEMSLTNVLQEFRKYLPAGVGLQDDKRQPDVGSHETWILVGTASNFKKVAYQTINHFMPAWHRAYLGEAKWNLCQAATQLRFAHKKAELAEAILKVQEDQDGDEAVLLSLLEDQSLLEDEEKFLKELASMDLFAEQVEGCGNCGILSMMALEKGLPQCLLDNAKRGLPRQKCLKLREDAGLHQIIACVLHAAELSELWRANCQEPAWQVLFEAFGERLATTLEMRKRARSEPEPATPKKKQKSKALPSGLSPEKPSDMPKRVNSCRPVSFGQPENKDTFLARAGAPVITGEEEADPEEQDNERIHVADEDLTVLPDAMNQVGVGPGIIRRAPHKRVRRRAPDTEQGKLRLMKRYLFSIKACYPTWQHLHFRLGTI